MAYYYQSGVIVPFVQKFYKQLIVVSIGLIVATSALLTASVSAASVPINGCTFIQTGNKWKLSANCTATAQINLPAGTRLDGKNKTITAGFVFTDNSNNSVIGIINADNVRVKDLKIDGTGGTGLHGVNTYQSQNVDLDDVTLMNNTKNGLVVNGSEVTVRDITTSGNARGAINVDQGGGVTLPSILTVRGRSHHTDTVATFPAHIYVDNMNEAVQVNDVRNQYSFSHPNLQPNDRLYTLKPVVDNHHDDDDHDD
jgi:hypothetical protein